MKKRFFTIIVLLVVFVIFSQTTAFALNNVPHANPLITYKTGTVSTSGSGDITVTFSVSASGMMDKLGASKIDLYTSSGSYVITLSSENYSNMIKSSTSHHDSSVTYSGNSGTSYYAVITFYAELNGNTTSAAFTTKAG